MRKLVTLFVLALFTISVSALGGNRKPQSQRSEVRKAKREKRQARREDRRENRQDRRQDRRDNRKERRAERRKTQIEPHQGPGQGIAVGEPNPATPVDPAPAQSAPNGQ